MGMHERKLTRQTTSAIIVSLALTAFISTVAAAELPKEGTFATTIIIHDENKEMEALPKRSAWTYETYGVQLNDAGSGFLHKVTGHCLGAGFNTNTEGGSRNTGHCVWMDSDGDKLFTLTENSKNRREDLSTGEATFIEGTGKYAGIQGKYEFTIERLKRLTESDPGHGISHTKGSYNIVGTQATQ